MNMSSPHLKEAARAGIRSLPANPMSEYAFRGQLQPALLALLPLVATIIIMFPPTRNVSASVYGIAVASGLTFLLAQATRALGRKLEPKLFKQWSGKPTTIWLRRFDNHLDSHTKERYYRILEEAIPGWKVPSKVEEKRTPKISDAKYDSAVLWLREKTRNKHGFSIVHTELTAYGFRRNTLAIKPVALWCSIFASVMNAGIVYFDWSGNERINVISIVACVSSVVYFGVWMFVVRTAWVRDAADAYARALLASCESIASSS
jgi:hypothetical protein